MHTRFRAPGSGPWPGAATIALSFAFVLEMSQVDDAPTPRTEADLAEVLEESPAPLDAAEKQKDEGRIRQQLNKRSSDAPATMKVTIAPAQPAPSTADALANAPALEEQARSRAEPARALALSAEKKEQSEGCDEDVRASADAWYQCVKDLRTAGQEEPARQELEALLAEFPDFHQPSEDKQEERQADR